jgi:hypothetical protein
MKRASSAGSLRLSLDLTRGGPSQCCMLVLDLSRKRVDVHVLDEQGQTVWVGVGSRSRVGREAGIKGKAGWVLEDGFRCF